MKIFLRVFISILFLSAINGLFAQSSPGTESLTPLKSSKSILFGTDKFINDQPQQDQKNIAICSAFNGWLYATYSYFNDSVNQDAFAVLRSKDNGITWSILYDAPWGLNNVTIIKLNILACGHDTNQLKVFIGFHRLNTISLKHGFSITRFDMNGIPEDEIYHDLSGYIKDFALASDNLYPATNSDPFSIGLVYSKETAVGDSIVFWSSSDGGMSMMVDHHSIAYTSKYFHKVALSYGRSPSCSSGRYFATWEEQENVNSTSGHIYTAHSEPDFNSPFTSPVLLDTLDTSSANNASSPVIACQNNGVDNDSSNFTEVVMYQKYLPTTQKFNVCGFYNKKATVSDNFRKFSIEPSSNNKIQPDISFNAFDSTFMVTFFDSTTQKLPYYIHDFNMTNPDAWVGLSAGYNDDNNLIAPHPQVIMDFGKQMGANAWSGTRGAGNGVATFDAPFHYYVGNPELSNDRNQLKVKVYPNPATNFVTLEFDLPRTENVELKLVNSMGQSLENISSKQLSVGTHKANFDLKNHPSGVYFFTISAGELFYCGKIFVRK